MAHNLGSSKRRKNLVRTQLSYSFPLRRSIIPEFPFRSKNAQKEGIEKPDLSCKASGKARQ
jgi:hypothetical protein